MPITSDQLRAALADLNGKRSVRLKFAQAEDCVVTNALLVPAEQDNIVKLTDGANEYLIDVESVVWVKIG